MTLDFQIGLRTDKLTDNTNSRFAFATEKDSKLQRFELKILKFLFEKERFKTLIKIL